MRAADVTPSAGRARNLESKAPRRLSQKSSEAIAAYLFLAPDVIGLFLVYIIPIAFTIFISFYSWSGVGSMDFVGAANYTDMFKDPIWLQSLGVIGLYILMYLPSVVIGSMLLALLTNSRLKEQKVYRTIFFFPIVVPMVIAAVVWQLIYEPSSGGILNYLLGTLGIPAQPFLGSSTQALFCVVVVTTWKQLGYYMIIYLAGLTDIPKEYTEAAVIDGAGPVKRFFHITLPLLKPIILFVTVVNMVAALQDFDQIYVLTRGGPNYGTYVQVFYFYEKAFKYLKMGSASAASTILFLIIFVLSLIQLKIFKGGEYES